MQNKYVNKNITYIFRVTETKKIRLGRDKSCEISLFWDQTYSKIQSIIEYDESLGLWKISDGSDKGRSRNGTWIFASQSYELIHGSVFRIASSKIQINMESYYS